MDVSGQTHTQAIVPPTKKPLVPQKKGWVDPRATLNALEKRKISFPCWGGASLRLSKSMYPYRAFQDYVFVWPKIYFSVQPRNTLT
jgi:hypothetical protein